MNTVTFFVGSLRKDSMNKKLAQNLVEIGKDLFSANLVFLHDIPMYNQDDEANIPAPVLALKKGIQATDGVIFVTPEYNRSIPAVLKNALDWGSRPWGQNSWAGKPAAIAGIAPGAVGTAAAQAHLRGVVPILNMPLMSQPEIYLTETPGFFDATGSIASEKTREFLHGFLSQFNEWITMHKK